MIHEALLYLWNHPGSFCNPNGEKEWFNAIELKDFIHPCERKLLQRIMHVAIDHNKIQEFIREVLKQKADITLQAAQEVFQAASLDNTNHQTPTIVVKPEDEIEDNVYQEIRPGLYLKAFCNGLDIVLETYRKEIIDLQQILLKDPQLSLTYIISRVEKYVTLFDVIKSMIRTIKTEKIHGCLLMGRILKYYNCGIEQVANASSQIVCSINIMFYRHLCNWIIFGDLVDVYQEFFICDAMCPDEDFLWMDASDSRSDFESFNVTLKSYRVRRPPKVRKFYLKDDMVPINMTLELAQTILFMGRMVWIIRNDPTNSQDSEIKLRLKRDIWDGKEALYFRKLQELESQPFKLRRFEKTIEDCKLCVTKYLWTVMVEETKLQDHLQLLRDYYAMGRGEVFQQFIVTVQERCKNTRSECLAFKMNSIFNETAKRLYSENDITHKRFEMYFSAEANKAEKNQWLSIEMNFEIVWPLHIIFHPGAMHLYNKLFNFLLRIKKAQIDLEKLWLMHMEGKHQIDSGVWALRNTLMFLINNLQYYLQVDVIEAQFAVLIRSVTNAQNVENIIKLHAEFLGNVMSRTFLMTMNDTLGHDQKNQLYKLPSLDYNNKKQNDVHSTLLLFLELCDEFCLKATTWEVKLTEIDEEELTKLQIKCEGLVEHLLTTLYSLREHASEDHLLQLLQRIDFNRWFSKNTPDFNLSVM